MPMDPSTRFSPAVCRTAPHEIGQEPAVYKIRPTHPGKIRRLTLMDKMTFGQFFVLAVTTGPDLPDASGAKDRETPNRFEKMGFAPSPRER